jgi:hypothetical protein
VRLEPALPEPRPGVEPAHPYDLQQHFNPPPLLDPQPRVEPPRPYEYRPEPAYDPPRQYGQPHPYDLQQHFNPPPPRHPQQHPEPPAPYVPPQPYADYADNGYPAGSGWSEAEDHVQDEELGPDQDPYADQEEPTSLLEEMLRSE